MNVISIVFRMIAIILYFGIFLSLIWLVRNLIKRKNKRKPIYIFVVCIVLLSLISSLVESVENNERQSMTIQKERAEEDRQTVEAVEIREKELLTEPNTDIENNEDEITGYSVENEEEFKSRCTEVIYNDLDDEWIGECVTKEILFTSSEENEYQCASTESYVEDYSGYQHVYTIYDIFDCRFDKSFPIYENDVIRIYGVITDIEMNWANGLEYPIIDMYYADYIREWRQPVESAKTMEELILERER